MTSRSHSRFERCAVRACGSCSDTYAELPETCTTPKFSSALRLCPDEDGRIMAAVTNVIHGYITDVWGTRMSSRPIRGQTRTHASSRCDIKDYQSPHGYAQIRGLVHGRYTRTYADIRNRFTVTYPRMKLATSALASARNDEKPLCIPVRCGTRRDGTIKLTTSRKHIAPVDF